MPCYHKLLSALLAALLCLPSEKSTFGGLSFLVVVVFLFLPPALLKDGGNRAGLTLVQVPEFCSAGQC